MSEKGKETTLKKEENIAKKEKGVPEQVAELYDLVASHIKDREGADTQYIFELEGVKTALDGFQKTMQAMANALVANDKLIAEFKFTITEFSKTIRSQPAAPPPAAPPQQPPPTRGPSGGNRSYDGGWGYQDGRRYGQQQQQRPQPTADGWWPSKWPTNPGEQVKRQDYASGPELDMAEDGATVNGFQYYWLTFKDGRRKDYIARTPVGARQG